MTFIAPGSVAAANGTWQGPGPNTAPALPGFFPPCTCPPQLQQGAQPNVQANANILWRSMGVGTISSICFQVATGSGNIAVGIYQGSTNSPNTNQYIQSLNRVAWSGIIPCPANGIVAQVPISPAPVQVNLNSYFGFWSDNTTATIFSAGNGWGGGFGPINSYSAGLCILDTTTGTALPTTLAINSGGRGVVLLLTGA